MKLNNLTIIGLSLAIFLQTSSASAVSYSKFPDEALQAAFHDLKNYFVKLGQMSSDTQIWNWVNAYSSTESPGRRAEVASEILDYAVDPDPMKSHKMAFIGLWRFDANSQGYIYTKEQRDQAIQLLQKLYPGDNAEKAFSWFRETFFSVSGDVWGNYPPRVLIYAGRLLELKGAERAEAVRTIDQLELILRAGGYPDDDDKPDLP
jgi:hypothetical protein